MSIINYKEKYLKLLKQSGRTSTLLNEIEGKTSGNELIMQLFQTRQLQSPCMNCFRSGNCDLQKHYNRRYLGTCDLFIESAIPPKVSIEGIEYNLVDSETNKNLLN